MLKMFVFDLDGTLADSKSAITKNTALMLKKLLDSFEVCIITGGNEEQIMTQVISNLPEESNLSNLHLMPTCGAKYKRFIEGAWTYMYQHILPQTLRRDVIIKIEEEARDLGIWESKIYGEIIEDRESQITFSALGQNAPLPLKEVWDTTGEKRKILAARLSPLFEDLDFRIGGSTSIDITGKNMDKSFGVLELMRINKLNKEELIFFGDRLEPGGNDYPVLSTGIKAVKVGSPEETFSTVNNILDK